MSYVNGGVCAAVRVFLRRSFCLGGGEGVPRGEGVEWSGWVGEVEKNN